MTNTDILKTVKQFFQKLRKHIGFSTEFVSAIIQFNIIQILEDSNGDIAAFAGEGDTMEDAPMIKAAAATDAAFVKQLS